MMLWNKNAEFGQSRKRSFSNGSERFFPRRGRGGGGFRFSDWLLSSSKKNFVSELLDFHFRFRDFNEQKQLNMTNENCLKQS